MKPTLYIPQSYGEDLVITRGDTIPEIPFAFSADEGINLIGANIECHFHKGSYVKKLSTGAGITITGALSFQFDKVEKGNDYPAGELKGDLQITESGGDMFTYCNIQITITDDKTK